MKKNIKIEGMMCQNCVRHVKQALEGLGLMTEVSLEEKQAIVTGEADDQQIIDAIEEAGYEVKEIIQ